MLALIAFILLCALAAYIFLAFQRGIDLPLPAFIHNRIPAAKDEYHHPDAAPCVDEAAEEDIPEEPKIIPIVASQVKIAPPLLPVLPENDSAGPVPARIIEEHEKPKPALNPYPDSVFLVNRMGAHHVDVLECVKVPDPRSQNGMRLEVQHPRAGNFRMVWGAVRQDPGMYHLMRVVNNQEEDGVDKNAYTPGEGCFGTGNTTLMHGYQIALVAKEKVPEIYARWMSAYADKSRRIPQSSIRAI